MCRVSADPDVSGPFRNFYALAHSMGGARYACHPAWRTDLAGFFDRYRLSAHMIGLARKTGSRQKTAWAKDVRRFFGMGWTGERRCAFPTTAF